MAPEVFDGIYSQKCDSWSCGVIMNLLLLGFNPFKGFNLDEVKEKVKSYRPNIDGMPYFYIDFENIDPLAASIVLNLTKINYIMRWSIK